jgi:hypothetical protein
MTIQQISGRKQNFRILVECPATGEQVLGDKLTHFSVPGAKAAWWYCPQCDGWHVLVHLEAKEANGELNSTKAQTLNLSSVQLSR